MAFAQEMDGSRGSDDACSYDNDMQGHGNNRMSVRNSWMESRAGQPESAGAATKAQFLLKVLPKERTTLL